MPKPKHANGSFETLITSIVFVEYTFGAASQLYLGRSFELITGAAPPVGQSHSTGTPIFTGAAAPVQAQFALCPLWLGTKSESLISAPFKASPTCAWFA